MDTHVSQVRYCDESCQRAHWDNEHFRTCAVRTEDKDSGSRAEFERLLEYHANRQTESAAIRHTFLRDKSPELIGEFDIVLAKGLSSIRGFQDLREKAAKLRARDSTAATQPNEANATVREYEADADAVPGVVAPPAREAESASTGGGLLSLLGLK